jgi:hypothetical protein
MEFLTITVSVSNGGSERNICECGIAKAKDYAKQFSDLPLDAFPCRPFVSVRATGTGGSIPLKLRLTGLRLGSTRRSSPRGQARLRKTGPNRCLRGCSASRARLVHAIGPAFRRMMLAMPPVLGHSASREAMEACARGCWS